MIRSAGLIVSFLAVVCFFNDLQAQEVKFGKIPNELLVEKFYANDSTAPAAVIYRDHSVRYDYTTGNGFQVLTYVHQRIKIYTKEGLDYATIREKLFQGRNGDESLNGLKGYTYNLENGKVEKSKLKGSDTFSREVNKYYVEETFTMPNVKEGSVIEFQYRISSPYSYSIDDVILQYDIPIAKQEVKISIPEYYFFKPQMRGYLAFNPKYYKENGKITYQRVSGENSVSERRTTSQHVLDVTLNVTEFNMENVEALKEEPYVNSMNNYRSQINFEIQQVKFPNSALEDFSSTWEKVAKTIYDNDDFGGELKIRKFHKEVINNVTSGAQGDKERAFLIFDHLKKHMVWNGLYGYFSDKGVKSAYEEKSGNVADINLLLTGLLRAAGLEANPVILSTRSHGIPISPSINGFNYVVVALDVNGERIYLDAVNDYLEPNQVAPEALNWMGRLITEDGTVSMVSLFPKRPSSKSEMMDLHLAENGELKGKVRSTHTGYNAYNFRTTKLELGEEEYLEDLENTKGGMEINAYSRKQVLDLGKPVVEEMEFVMDAQASVIGDQMYFSPLFFESLRKNPFKRETRSYPVDFNYPIQRRVVNYISIPAGYEISSFPEGTKMSLPEGQGSFTYMVKKIGSNKLQVLYDMKILTPVIGANYYPSLKEFFKNIIEKHGEKVVLSKTSTDGTAEGSAGGR